ncbi:complement C3-like [Cheilinus undulatus]|uniref:complement C3-like n=1 Tax=Cheilinus undulatus TaxID=241271 RepID=UPI001BD3556F|nr:complement C3-like [Cheilinus undulatus]
MLCWTQLPLLAFLVFNPLGSEAGDSPLEVMSAPNLLRVGTAENIFVEIQDCRAEHNINVVIRVMNHPTRTNTLTSTTVTLTKANKYQGLGQLTIPVGDFSMDPKVKQYVVLQAQFPNHLLEKVVLVSFQSGYIFIQTDKTIYTPNSNVLFRMFGVKPSMEPVERNTQTDASISIEIMTPDRIVAQTHLVSLTSGIYSGTYQLGEIVSPGQWTLVAKFQSNPQQTFSAEFEVKEYVLPSFEVKLIPVSPFFYVDSQELTVNIEAIYLFGEEVTGMAYVVFGVMDNDEKRSFPSSLQRVPILRGAGSVTLRREHIIQTFPNINELVKKNIYVAVSVLTESGDEMVETELRSIQIVTSPYTITFKRTPRYFKPGMSFDVTVEVLNPDDTPARNIQVIMTPGPVTGFTEDNGMARLSINTAETTNPLQIEAKTSDPLLPSHRQASAIMQALPHRTAGNNYIHIGLDKAEVTVRENVKVNLIFNRQENRENDITYLILSRGRLIKYDRFRTDGQVLVALIIPITKEMLPSFRIIAYYHTNNNEVVSDSLWVDVKDSCMGSLKLEQAGLESVYKPRGTFNLKVTGDPGAIVGLVAVDKGVYVLNNKHRLTQKKIWDIVEKSDTGCTAGGGADSMGVFYDAGLLFVTSSSGTAYRLEPKCPGTSRRKRASTIMEVRTSLLSHYKEELERECCLSGLKEIPVPYNCERRSEYIGDGQACVDAFLHCCREMENQQGERKEGSLLLARSEEDDGYRDMNEIVSRTKFPESWLWSDIPLPSCSQCETTSVRRSVPLPDSITTWQFTGISLSRTHGICVADPLEVIVRKRFFIDLRLPYSAVRGEQLEIKAILHNYSPEAATVRVDLLENPDLCSAASKRGKYRKEVEVGASTTRAVPFIIIPMKVGQHPIEVKAVVKDSYELSDGISKKLRVVSPGVLQKIPKHIELNPSRTGGEQIVTVNSDIPLNDMVPDTPTNTLISLTGREQMGTLLESAISGNAMGVLINRPSGCGEQNIAAMTLPVIAAAYLDKTNQWEKVGFEKRNEALDHIRTGYQGELAYRKSDGSFAVFKNSRGSSWLTAYVVKVFAMANNLVGVPSNVICDAVKFLILNAQQPDGMFGEIGDLYSREMRSDVLGSDSHASMTAFCLIAMQESRHICGDSVNSLSSSVNNAVSYLEQHLPRLTNPYAVAITSYALANENRLNIGILYNFVSRDQTHWPVRTDHIYTLEATAYALLALVKTRNFEKAKPVVRWFKQQQKSNGGYGSTQATIMVYQAVAEYWGSAEEPPYDLNVDLSLPGRSLIEKFKFNKQNHFTTRSSKFNSINKDVRVTATGSGEATLTMLSLYYAQPKEKESDCQKFDLTVEVLPEKLDDDEKTYRLRLEVLFKDSERNASMSILDIGLPTGFIINTKDLDNLSQGRARIIEKYEINRALSEKGSLIIYLDKVSNTRIEIISFRIHQKMNVGILQPAAVSVYEYYEEKPCVKFYHPQRSAELLRLCKNEECTCAEEGCSMQRKGEINNDERSEKACETTETSKIDFVYKIRVDGFTDGFSMDIYTARVMEVFKEGTNDVAPRGQLRTFLSFPQCRTALDLKIGKTYLIMGASKDIYRLEQNQSFQYVLGQNTWIEYWPTEAECQRDEYRHTCLGMEDLVGRFELFGCEQ